MARELQRGNRPHETGAAQKSRGANRQSAKREFTMVKKYFAQTT